VIGIDIGKNSYRRPAEEMDCDRNPVVHRGGWVAELQHAIPDEDAAHQLARESTGK
jgi:hypothetical protein